MSRDRERGRLPTKSMMGGRIYIGKLPLDVRKKDVDKLFSKFGRISEISMKGNYCFVQYESSRDSKDAVYEMNDRTAFGKRILVEHARVPREVRGSVATSSSSRSGGGGGPRRRSPRRSREPHTRSGHRILITNLSTRCDEQDLKAVMGKAGAVCYADCHRARIGEGFVEFLTREDMDRALKKLDGLEINGKPIKLEMDESQKKKSSRSPHSRSRSRSCSKPRSRSLSHSKSRKKRTSSQHSAASGEDEGGMNGADVKKESKSDDEEFEEAERNVKKRRSRSKEEANVKHESDDEEFEEAERNVKKRRSQSKPKDIKAESDDEEFDAAERNVKRRRQEAGSDTESDNECRNGVHVKEERNDDDDEETEEVEEEVEEIIEEEVEVDDEDSCEEGGGTVNGH